MNFKSKRRKVLYYFPLILILLIAFGTGWFFIFKGETTPEPEIEHEAEPFVPTPIVKKTKDLSEGAWAVYWEPDSNETIEKLGYTLGEEVLFACLFDERGNLYIPDNLVDLRESIPWNTESNQYLSITNDVVFDDGRCEAKTVRCLEQLLTSPKHMDNMAQNMFDAAVSLHCNGVELDLENITGGTNFWPQFVKFIDRCIYWADRYDMKLRVALGAYAPMSDYNFPEDVEYVYMCYALHGKFNDPGPKVTQDFLYKTVKRFKNVKNKRFAISNECFDWWPAKTKGEYECVTLTLDDIYKIFETYEGVNVHRDPDSYGLYFNYWNEDGKHTVWYQDEKTFDFWKQKLREYNGDENTGVDLWRIE